jgi:4-amino-4-deoxy-L-arabinose transferase-like glycosyltransferase
MSQREKWIAIGLVALWAVLFLPHCRTSPNWYGDEGEWMEKSWTFIHGTPRVGPIVNDFVYPYPYPPLYMLVNGALLRVFGYDLVVSRVLGAVTALGAAALLFWIGCRLRDRLFGFVCAAAFLCYSEAVINFRWVRSHPFAGMLALASVGFLVRYVQEKRLRDIALAGVMCSLATATHYMAYPLIGAVIVTAFVVNWGRWRAAALATLVAAATAGAYGAGFVLWYVAAHGLDVLRSQVALLGSVAGNEAKPTFGAEVFRLGQNVWTFCAKTPTQGPPLPWAGRDWWLVIAAMGFVFLPVTKNKWLRAWLPFWLLVLMYGVFKKLNNVPMFLYPATVFLPLLAVGLAGVVTWTGELCVRVLKSEGVRWVPAVVGLVVFALPTLTGSLGGFRTKIDWWAQQSVPDAEATLAYVNARTTADDLVIVPKQVYWLVRPARRSMLTYAARYRGVDNDMPVATHIAENLYWFDPRLERAKYVVLEAGERMVTLADGRQVRAPAGIDAVYTIPVLTGVRELVVRIQQEKWPLAFQQGAYMVLANPQLVKDTK